MTDEIISSAFKETEEALDGMGVGINTPQLLRQVAARLSEKCVTAVRHPLGFIKIDLTTLVATSRGYEYRLHIWAKNYERNDGLGSIHDHSWEMTSAVLSGELVDTNLVATADPDGRHALVRVTYKEDGFSFTPSGRCNFAVQTSRKVKAPSVYRLPANVLHMTEVRAEPTVTLVVADRSKGLVDEPRVVVDGENLPPSHGPREVLGPDEASSILRTLAGQIA